MEATLTAALAEPEIAEQVRTGRLIRAATYAGFGEVPRPRLRLVTDDGRPSDEDDEDRTRTRRRGRGRRRDGAGADARGSGVAAERRRRERAERAPRS